MFDLDEVVIVSQPKEVLRLRRQPLSSSVLSGRDLNNIGVRDLTDLSAYVPSFVMPSYGSRLTSSVYVRGIGSRVNNPAVGIYIDGIPLVSKNSFNFHVYQLDRVDVLRGPQGTLYGMNTEGGLMRLYSKNPINYQGTDISVGMGTHFYRNVEAAHYGRSGDNFAFSVAGFYGGQNGFFRNSVTDRRADVSNEAGAKTRLSAAVKGGSNDEFHNHNDVGGFVLAVDGTVPVIVDPGAEYYSGRSFSSRRYESNLNNSFGHSVPRINGELQIAGKKRLAVRELLLGWRDVLQYRFGK